MTGLESYKEMIEYIVNYLDDETARLKEMTGKASYIGYAAGYNAGVVAGHEWAVDFMKNFMKGWIESYNEREGNK